MDNKNRSLGPLIVGILLIVGGAHSIITGDGGTYHGVPIVNWIGWCFLPIGIVLCVFSIHSGRRNGWKLKKKEYTDEDVAQAKAELDRMYLKEHGSLPEDMTRKKDT